MAETQKNNNYILGTVILVVAGIVAYVVFSKKTTTTGATNSGSSNSNSNSNSNNSNSSNNNSNNVPSGNDSYGNPYTYRGYSIKLLAGGIGGPPGTFVGIDKTTQGWIDTYLTPSTAQTGFNEMASDAAENHFVWVPALIQPQTANSNTAKSFLQKLGL